MKYLATIGVIGALVLGAAACGEDSAEAKGPLGCNPGEWAFVTVNQPNGDISKLTVKAVLPEGTSLEGGSSDGERIVYNADGSVEASGGEVTVECATPTH